MALTQLMALGKHVFYTPAEGVDAIGFENLQRDSSYSWIPQGRLNAPVAMQYTGPGQDVLVIEGRLFPHFFGGLKTLNDLRAAGVAGKPLTLTRFYPIRSASNVIEGIVSEVLGTFVIQRVRSGEKNISSANVASHVDFQIEICAYGNDSVLRSQVGATPATVNTPAGTTINTTTGSPAQ